MCITLINHIKNLRDELEKKKGKAKPAKITKTNKSISPERLMDKENIIPNNLNNGNLS
jgi:hypothetical protein